MALMLKMPRVVLDLNSASATKSANITFSPASSASTVTLVEFSCHDCLDFCRATRQWLLKNADDDDTARLIRLENQDLDLYKPDTCGTLVLLDGAACLDGCTSCPITLLALFTPRDHRVRFFWSLLSFCPLLLDLGTAVLISQPDHIHHCDDIRIPKSEYERSSFEQSISGGMGMVGGAALALGAGMLGVTMMAESAAGNDSFDRRQSFYTFLTQTFLQASSVPHSKDYAAALQIADYCPPVEHPNTACHRIEGNTYLNFSGEAGRDLSDDRYIHEVEPAERELISVVEMTCAAYILFKRRYFKAFSKDVLRDGDKIQQSRRYGNDIPSPEKFPAGNRSDTPASDATGTPAPADKQSAAYSAWAKAARAKASQTAARNSKARVRTDSAHIRRIESDLGCTFTKAKKLFTGWTLLGMLDESRVLKMVQDGYISEEEEDNDEIEDNEDEVAEQQPE